VQKVTGFNSKREAAGDKVQEPEQEPIKLWLWKNFVDGRPEYWAFDNPFPCITAGGDPLTLGEPCGWALFKTSVNGRPNSSEQEVVDAVMRLSPLPAQPAQRPWVGLTDAEIHGTPGYNETREMYLFALTLIAKLQEKNNG